MGDFEFFSRLHSLLIWLFVWISAILFVHVSYFSVSNIKPGISGNYKYNLKTFPIN